jgi:hypothetical protein
VGFNRSCQGSVPTFRSNGCTRYPPFPQTTRRLRKGWRDSSAPAFNVAQIRRDLPAIAFHAAGSVSIQKANGALGAAVSRHYLLFCRLINPFIAAHKLRRRGAGGDAVRGVVGLAIIVDAAAGGALVLAVFVGGRFLLPRDSGIKRSSNSYHRPCQGFVPPLNPLAARVYAPCSHHYGSCEGAWRDSSAPRKWENEADLPALAFHGRLSRTMARISRIVRRT